MILDDLASIVARWWKKLNRLSIKTSLDEKDILMLAEEAESLGRQTEKQGNKYENDETFREHAKADVIKNLAGDEFIDEDLIRELARKYEISFLIKPYAVVMFSHGEQIAPGSLNARSGGRDKLNSILNITRELLEEYLGGYLMEWENKWVAVFLTLPEEKEEQKGYAEEFCERLIRSMDTYFNMEVSLGVSMCKACSRIAGAVRDARRALTGSFYSEHPGCCFYSDTDDRQIEFPVLEEYRNHIAGLLNEMNYGCANAVLKELLSLLTAQKPDNTNDLYNMIIQLHYIFKQHIQLYYSGIKDERLEYFGGCSSFGDFMSIYALFGVFEEALERLETLIKEDRESYYKKIIHKAKTYIMEHLDEDTNLEAIAGYVNLSPSYFSEIFKERTGEKFIDYVISLKITKAKEYISRGEKVYSVMEKLGYGNYSYFCRLFRKVTGKSLKQFKHQMDRG